MNRLRLGREVDEWNPLPWCSSAALMVSMRPSPSLSNTHARPSPLNSSLELLSAVVLMLALVLVAVVSAVVLVLVPANAATMAPTTRVWQILLARL
jgi:hypothetical protein